MRISVRYTPFIKFHDICTFYGKYYFLFKITVEGIDTRIPESRIPIEIILICSSYSHRHHVLQMLSTQ